MVQKMCVAKKRAKKELTQKCVSKKKEKSQKIAQKMCVEKKIEQNRIKKDKYPVPPF